jgi:hypothetical protein
MKDMIDSLEYTGLLNGQDIQRLLDDADSRVISLGIGADCAGISFGDIEAGGTLDDAFFYPRNGLGKTARLVCRASQDEECQSLGCFGTDAWQLSQLFDKRRYRRRGCLHVVSAVLVVCT